MPLAGNMAQRLAFCAGRMGVPAAAMRFAAERGIVEGAAAMSPLAGSGKVVAIVSGGNIDIAMFCELLNSIGESTARRVNWYLHATTILRTPGDDD